MSVGMRNRQNRLFWLPGPALGHKNSVQNESKLI